MLPNVVAIGFLYSIVLYGNQNINKSSLVYCLINKKNHAPRRNQELISVIYNFFTS
jgi:GTP-binding protein EngB required for normal cell division